METMDGEGQENGLPREYRLRYVIAIDGIFHADYLPGAAEPSHALQSVRAALVAQ